MLRLLTGLVLSFWLGSFVEGDDSNGAQPPAPFSQDEYLGKTVSSMEEARAIVEGRFFNAPTLGSKAPEFVLESLETGKSVFLSGLYRERPVVILFASYGCDVFRDGLQSILEVYAEHHEEVEFVMVYIREAHSVNGLHPQSGVVKDPATKLERRAVAKRCREELDLPFPILLDLIDDRTATRWAAWPVRAFVIDCEGIVVYAGKSGPWGFDPGGGFKPHMAEQMKKYPGRFSEDSLEEFLAAFDSK